MKLTYLNHRVVNSDHEYLNNNRYQPIEIELSNL